MDTMSVKEGTTVLAKSVSLARLSIAEGGAIAAPEGKYLTLTVDGVTYPPDPGVYEGDVRITISDNFTRSTFRFGEETISNYHAAVIIDDGNLQKGSSVPAAVQGGSVTSTKADGIRIDSREWNFNGFYITGDSNYSISNSSIYLKGDGTDDFVGMGAAIAVSGNADVKIQKTKVRTEGIGRGTLFVGGNAHVSMEECEFATESYVPTPEQLEEGRKQERMMEPPWAIGLRGNGRALNLAECGTLDIDKSHVTSNSWGVLSIDGARVNRLNVKDSLIEILGKNGYGCFCICDDLMFDYEKFGEPGCIDTIDHSVFNVAYTGILMSLGNGQGEFKNGSIVNSERFGAFIHRNNGGKLKINSRSVFHTKSSCIVVKGSNTYFELDDAVMEPENGTILQLMDNDDVGMCDDPFLIPVGEVDKRDDRDLSTAIPDEDIFVTVSNMEARGNFLNSTTDFRACNRRIPKPGVTPPEPPQGAEKLRGFIGDTLMGAKNLDLKVKSASIIGIISAANAYYKEGLTRITKENCEELSNITQVPAEPINNGVIVSIDAKSTWFVTGTSYLTKLTIEEGGKVTGADGKTLEMYIDGEQKDILPGTYVGMIQLSLS